jgi:hypothetical protein
MPITLPPSPPGFDQALTRAVGRVSSAGLLKFAALGGAGAGPAPSAQHRVYTMALSDVAAGQRVSAARPASWRAFLVQAQTPVAVAEVAETAGGQLAPEASITEGPLVAAAADAIGVAEQAQAVAVGAYELRVLHVPAVYVLAVWLHGPQDLFVPIRGAGLTLRKVYHEGDFFTAIQPAAKALVAQTADRGAALY